MDSDKKKDHLPIGRNIKIGFFHLGSGIADVMTTGVWNRIMISDLGFSATPIGLLVSLRYFLAPLGVWAGRMSDERVIWGTRRLFWIWLGRLMMFISTIMLGLGTAQIARTGEATALLWSSLVIALLLFSLGNAISGSTFLALVYDRAPQHQRGRAVGIVWTFLLLGFTVGGIFFGVLLPESDSVGGLSFVPDALQTLFIITAVVLGILWVVSLLGEERRRDKEPLIEDVRPVTSLRADLSLVWQSRPLRFFMLYLALSMFFAFSQDLILEPFGGDVFGMPAATTNRFSAYWGSMAILGTLVFMWLSRTYRWLNNTNMAYIGVGVLALTFALFALSAFGQIRGLVTPGLILLGVGLGIWNVGTLGLMMDMSPTNRAGTFLGFWTLLVTFARGFGVSGGGILHDITFGLTGSEIIAYGLVFVLGAIGLVVAYVMLRQVDAETKSEGEIATLFVGAME